MNIAIDKNDEIVMQLLHYFITEQEYNPIILQGAKDEIWLENSEGNYKIIRLVTNYIHNKEQLEWDLYRTKKIVGTIKRKTFSFNMNVLSIFVNLGDNVDLKEVNHKNIDCIELKNIKDVTKYEYLTENFPDIDKIKDVEEKGFELFIKLTEEINKKNKEDATKADEIFSKKKPIITYALIISNIIMYIMLALSGGNIFDIEPSVSYDFGGLVNYNSMSSPVQLYRLITSMFLHGGIFHLIFNMYSLYVLGPQIESFFGKIKYFFIYMISGIIGGLVSMIFLPDATVCIGASGALFGLIGAFIVFGYHYRVYFGQIIRSQIIPLLMLNLAMGLFIANISMSAHIGGLVGGVLITKAFGVKYKTSTSDNVNGWIMLTIFLGFLIYMIGVFK